MVYQVMENQEINDEDVDTCSSDAIDNIFHAKCQLLTEKQIVTDESYILHMNGSGDANFYLAVALTNNLCEVYCFDNNHLLKLDTLEMHSACIAGIKISPENNNLIYTASHDGNIKLWDLRLPNKLVIQLSESSENCKPIISFDVSSNNRLVATGTESFEGEAFILFWDVRHNKLLGGYWESHTDDITQVKFNPYDMNLLTSGSTDGLINIYDLKHSCEDDALIDTFNTESSVELLTWYGVNGKPSICCFTHTVDVQLWQTDAAEPYAHFSRCDIAREIKRKSESHCYLTSAHNYQDELFLLAGSNENDGECVRSVRTYGKKLIPYFNLKENKQRVRCSWYNQHHNLLVTGGEGGNLNVWCIN